MQNIYITGISGFIGKHLSQTLSALGYIVSGCTHKKQIISDNIKGGMDVLSLSRDTIWKDILENKDTVIHLAGRAHILKDNVSDPLSSFREVNTAATLHLAREAVKANVKRFIFISSIGVNGTETNEHYFTENIDIKPSLPYAISKYEAEIGLREIENQSEMEVVIIRPPLVIGPNAPGNLNRLFKLVSECYFLPFKNVKNKRSFISLYNLCDFVATCIKHPLAKGETFVICDGQDISTSDLVLSIAEGMGKKLILFPIPIPLVRSVATLFGRRGVFQQLYGCLQVDNSKARNLLQWHAPLSIKETIIDAAKNYNDKT